MSHALTALLAFIVGVFLVVGMESDIRADYTKAGVMIIKGQPYKLVPFTPQ